MVRICPQPNRLLDQEGEELNRMMGLVRELEPADLHRMLGTVIRHVDDMSRSSFPKLRLEMALLEVCEQGPTLPIVDLLDALGDLANTPRTDGINGLGDKKKEVNESDISPARVSSHQNNPTQPSMKPNVVSRRSVC